MTDDNNNYYRRDISQSHVDGDDGYSLPSPQAGSGARSSSLRSPSHGAASSPPPQRVSRSSFESDLVKNDSDHRGFATSITDMFDKPEYEREDCCAITCCGVFQADRNRYLITNIPAPSWQKRWNVHFCTPLLIFAWAMVCAINIPDQFLNQLLSTGFVVCLVLYLCIQCSKGSIKRKQARKNLLWSKYNYTATRGHFQHYRRPDNHGDDDDSDAISSDASQNTENLQYMMGQTPSDINNSQGLWGFYLNDMTSNSNNRTDVEGGDVDATSSFNKKNIRNNLCSKLFHCVNTCCCGLICKRHIQLCGMCAVAQEARELELLLPERMKQIDYITMQPIIQYYPLIYQDRHVDNRLQHKQWWSRLSELSKLIVYTFGGVSGILLIWSLLSPFLHHNFGFGNFVVFCLTVLQAVGFLAVVHWHHALDVSVDALIKYFASGFCLSTSLAVTYELIVGLIIRIIMTSLISLAGIETVEENGYSMTGMTSGIAGNLLTLNSATTTTASATYREYIRTWGNDHPVAYAIYLLITSFLLAALIEEICKYFGYRMVDHPDFYSQRKLDEAVAESDSQQDFSQQDNKMKSKGAATTVAMVATALGYACCENIVYVFIYGRSPQAGTQVGILLLRSILPVHPLAAAIQSIRVVRRDVEKDDRMTLGRIVLPSIILHGVYDFMAMLIDFIYERRANYIMDDDQPFTRGSNQGVVNCLVSLAVLLVGAYWYLRNALKQRKRLEALDQSERIDNSRLI